MKQPIKAISLLTIGLLFSACESNEPKEMPEIASQLTLPESRALEESDGFGEDFLRAAAELNPADNLIVSPFGAQVMLGMLANATDEEATQEIITALGCEDLSSLNSALAKLTTILPDADKRVKVTSANSLWYNKNRNLLESFHSALEMTYGAVFYTADFADAVTTSGRINTWTKEHTNGLITQMITPNDVAELEAMLINALYFSGKWTDSFETSKTRKAVFHGVKSDSEILMMNKKFETTVSYCDNCRIVRIPFGERKFFIDLILPDEGTDCNDVILNRSLVQDKMVNLTLSLPRFEIRPDRRIDISSIFSALGCTKLVESSRLNIYAEKISLSIRSYQNATIKITEEGAEAAAVTYTMMDSANVPAGGSDNMVFDRPFALKIGEESTGITLFAGRVTDL